MKIHKEGTNSIIIAFLVVALLIVAVWYFSGTGTPFTLTTVAGITLFALVVRFFRVPARTFELIENVVYAPCDGRVVVIEEVTENECLHDRRIQISVFMSVNNVHINFYPISGMVKYVKHHSGRYMAAWLPKSSQENERATTLIEHKNGTPVVIRQIAGAMARRIVTYAQPEKPAKQCDQLGFIKFGSRVDLFLPLDSTINVKLDQKVVGGKTPIAQLK